MWDFYAEFSYYKIVRGDDKEVGMYTKPKGKYALLFYHKSVGEGPYYRLAGFREFRGELRQYAIDRGYEFKSWPYPGGGKVYS